jgi:four helix bundle protein
MAKKVDELPLYQKAVTFCAAVLALLNRPGLRKDRGLHKQLDEANDSITANMEEGFEQSTDAAFANYMVISKGSLGEVLGRLRTARRKGYITQAELTACVGDGEELGRMMGGFIRYLSESNFKDRGRFKSKSPKPTPGDTSSTEVVDANSK